MAAAELSKLYKVEPEKSQNISATIIIEFKGTSLMMYGTEEQPASITSASDMTEAFESAVTTSKYLAIDWFPTYIAFTGTMTRLNIKGVKLTEIKPLV